jgi:hypothetical protein
MGHTTKATCLVCGESFTVKHDGGLFFHLVRCDTCGKTKTITFDRLGELHLRYLKGLSGPYCVASAEHDRHVRENMDIEPISEDEYLRGVEKFAGKCSCRGKYTFDAIPRCPECRSADIEEGEPHGLYD